MEPHVPSGVAKLSRRPRKGLILKQKIELPPIFFHGVIGYQNKVNKIKKWFTKKKKKLTKVEFESHFCTGNMLAPHNTHLDKSSQI